MKLTDLPVDAYLLYENPLRGTHITLLRMPYDEGVRWAIYKSSSACLSKSMVRWIVEVLPSNRTKEHFRDTRWATAQEALDFWETVKDQAIKRAEGSA
jgi:hypothetical protein